MRDGRRLEYYSKEQRAEMQELKKLSREAMDTTDEAAAQAVLAAANAADTSNPNLCRQRITTNQSTAHSRYPIGYCR